VQAGVVDVAVACGVEVMSRVPIGSNASKKLGFGIPIPKPYFEQYEMTSQFEGAERIADKWDITRSDTDEFGLRSQMLAAQAWEEARFATQVVAIDAPDLDDDGKPTGTTHLVERDEGLRDTPKAKIVDTCLVGVDPVLMLTGPIDATQRLFARTGLSMSDIDVVEINEAFASVVLAWARELEAPMDIVNPNGGAIALGHPLGGTGAFLMTKAVHELGRSDSSTALITMCCGGGLGTGTIIERL
jgi:acetyl-CoA C-acetyltransferase